MLEPPGMSYHVAVCVKNHIIVFGGRDENDENDENDEALSLRNIWMYNVCTEQWRLYGTTDGIVPPGTQDSCAVVIAGDIYMFGGWVPDEFNFTNAVWRLTRTTKRCFEWRTEERRTKKKTPSPRDCHSVWEYKGQLWTFGGHGLPLAGYLNDHGDFQGKNIGQNNQLLCYDPMSKDWRNPKPSGTIPKPRSKHRSAIIGDKVWTYGGLLNKPWPNLYHTYYDELYQLNMVSLTWTEIQTGQVKPPYRTRCSLTSVTENRIVLHGGECTSHESLKDTWILDLSSLSWKRYEASKGVSRTGHTGTACINTNIIIIGGNMSTRDENGILTYKQLYSDAFSVKLEPKTLQQVAIQKIYHHRDVLPWKVLPNSLKARLLFPVVADVWMQQSN